MPNTVDAAREYLARGWSVFPIHDKRRPAIQWEMCQSARLSDARLSELFSDPSLGVACALGKLSGVVRLDVDSDDAATEARRRYGELITLAFRSPSGGAGYVFQYAANVQSETLWIGQGQHNELRFLSDGRYTVLPPTVGYEWLNDLPIAPLPTALADELLSLRTERALRELERQLAPTVVDPGEQIVLEALRALDPARCDDRDCWLQVGMALHSSGDQYLQAWVDWSRASDKFKDGECERAWAEFHRSGRITVRTLLFLAKQDGWEAPSLHEPLTDVGNGRTLARACAGRALYCREWSKWLRWDGARWENNAELAVMLEQKGIVRERQLRAARSIATMTGDEEERKRKVAGVSKVVAWCTVSESAARMHAALDMARSEPGILVGSDLLDQHPWQLNCLNGTLDLRTSKLASHDPNQYITQLCPTEYFAEALAPRWMQFLDEVFSGNASIIGWVQKLLGYCLTGVIAEHILPIFYGGGRNGKSTLVKTVVEVLGKDYASTTPSGYLAQTRGEAHPTKFVVLHGKRFVADLETSDDMKLNEEMVKRVTGGDEINARRMKEDFWTFRPTHKLMLATNHEPKVKGFDVAIWSRLKKVPFLVSFQGREDRQLDEKLRSEASGILAWMVRGCDAWQREGLKDVAEIAVATEAYRSEQDTVSLFVADKLEKAPGNRVRKVDVVSAYRAWCSANSVEPVNAKTFGSSIAKQGVASDDTGKWYADVKVA